MISIPSRVLCLMAHPDDLEPQAGGTIARLVIAGSRVHVVHALIPDFPGRDREAQLAAGVLGITVDNSYEITTTELSHSTAMVKHFDQIATEFNPDLIISHHEVDTHQDHVMMARIAQTICRRNQVALWQVAQSVPGGYLAHRPQPNLFVDITSTQATKMAAVKMYRSQVDRYSGLFEDNWLEIIEARDRYYGGLLNQDGMTETKYAEGFVVGKMVWA